MTVRKILSIIALVLLLVALGCGLFKMTTKNPNTKKSCENLMNLAVFLAIILLGVSQLLREDFEGFITKGTGEQGNAPEDASTGGTTECTPGTYCKTPIENGGEAYALCQADSTCGSYDNAPPGVISSGTCVTNQYLNPETNKWDTMKLINTPAKCAERVIAALKSKNEKNNLAFGESILGVLQFDDSDKNALMGGTCKIDTDCSDGRSCSSGTCFVSEAELIKSLTSWGKDGGRLSDPSLPVGCFIGQVQLNTCTDDSDCAGSSTCVGANAATKSPWNTAPFYCTAPRKAFFNWPEKTPGKCVNSFGTPLMGCYKSCTVDPDCDSSYCVNDPSRTPRSTATTPSPVVLRTPAARSAPQATE